MARKTDSSDEKLDPSLIHKKKARRRLVGALAFLGSTAIALPFLLDAEPKPSTQEVQIRVPVREASSGAVPEAATPTGSAPAMVGGAAPNNPAGVPSSGNTSSSVTTAPVLPVIPPLVMDSSSGKKDDAKKDEGKKAEAGKEAGGKDAVKVDDSGDKADAKADAAKADALKKEAAQKEAAKKEAAKKESAKLEAAKKDAARKDAAKKDNAGKDDAKSSKADEKKSDSHKGYSVQIGAFSSEDSAKEQLSKAGKLGLKTYSEKVSTSGGARYRARVGPFASREQAEQALAKLKLNGIDAAVVAP